MESLLPFSSSAEVRLDPHVLAHARAESLQHSFSCVWRRRAQRREKVVDLLVQLLVKMLLLDIFDESGALSCG